MLIWKDIKCTFNDVVFNDLKCYLSQNSVIFTKISKYSKSSKEHCGSLRNKDCSLTKEMVNPQKIKNESIMA